MESQPTPTLSPKSQEASSVNENSILRPTNSNTSLNSKERGSGVVSPLGGGGASPLVLKDPLIIDIDHQQPSLAACPTSREGLRRQVERRRMTLTVPERNFLDHLVVHGNQVEVQLAYERLDDNNLFFDWQTPRHLKASENQAPEEATDSQEEEEEPSITEDIDGAEQQQLPKAAMKRSMSLGSQRRLQILEDRKTSKSPLWQAHESGIAVTQTASKKSIFKRSGSAMSLSSVATPQMIRDSSRFSFCSSQTGSVGDITQQDIFRRIEPKPLRVASPVQKAKQLYQRSQSLVMMAQPSLVSPPPPRAFGAAQRRSSTSSRKSVTFSSQTKPPKTMRRSTSDMVLTNLNDQSGSTMTRPPLPPALAQRSESMASIPSIHHATPLRSDSIASRSNSISSIPSIRHVNAFRSSSISSIPSIRHANAIRSNSISSIPSIHHANAIRGESISSIPSIHPANAIRGESISTIPSIHPANAIRGESISSIPSIHPANAIRSDSSSTAMLPNQLQIISNRDVVSGTFPTGMIDLETLDHSLMDDDDTLDDDDPLSASRNNKKLLDHQNSIMVPRVPQLGNREQQQLLPTYSATPDIATAWLNQQQDHFQSKPFDLQSQGSFPPAIQIPSTITDKTEETSTSNKEELVVETKTKPVLVRSSSRNSQYYDGEGMEVTVGDFAWPSLAIRQCTSFDEESMSTYNHRRQGVDDIFRKSIRRTFSDEEVVAANMMVGTTPMIRQISNLTISKRQPHYMDSEDDDGESWDMQSQPGGEILGGERFDSWNILKDEYVNGYGGGGSLDFMILGTCADDISASPHVLSPPMMESLTGFLPYAQSNENFFLRYSLVRDGASMLTFLKRSRGVQYAILALETVDGEVFGCFTGQPWRQSPNYFGTGECFLWRMRRSRLEATSDILEQAQLESEIDVFPFTGENQFFQLCTHDRIAVGGGTPSGEKKTCDPPINPHEWGFGLDIQGDMLVGSSSPCVTFDSPSLSKVHADGSLFEIVNLELWTLTPCTSVQDAERLELGKLFLDRQ